MAPPADRPQPVPPQPAPVPLRPLEGQPLPASTLPRPLTSFVGREREVAAVVDRLRRPDVRLLTLTGPAGVGKTRLAIRVAAGMTADVPDGIWFVPLAPIRDPALVASTVAQVLGVRDAGDRPIEEVLAAFLGDRQALLVLDNLEHLLDAAPQLADLLADCPSLSVLVTSRAVLRVSGEHDFSVPPLALPAAGRPLTLEELARIEAVALFVTRARAADPSFALTDANAASVATICERLDGLPLAIELAAARVRVLSPPAILARLDHRLTLLTGGARDQPPRLRSMRDAVAWSHDLLAPAERALLSRLAVFVGGFTIEGAEAVGGGRGRGDEPSSATSLLDGVTELISQSLLKRLEGPAEAPRFGMLETVREYALERLAASGEETEIRHRHALWCLAVAERLDEAIWGPELRRCLDQLEAEQANFLAALAWALEAGEIEFGLRLTAALWNFYLFRGLLSEARQWQARLLGAASDLPPQVRATALWVAGEWARTAGDHAAAVTQLDESLSLARQAGDPLTLGMALYMRGLTAEALDDHDRQVALCAEALAQFRNLGAAHWIVETLLCLGRAARKQADYAQARALHEEALAVARERSDAWGIAWAATELAEVTADEGDTGRAAALYAESVRLHADHGDQLGVDLCLLRLAKIAGPRGRPGDATRLLAAAEVMREHRGSALSPADRAWHDGYLTDLRARLGEAAFAAEYTAGRALTLAQAVAVAEAVAVSPPALRATAPPHGLTPRELEVLALLAEGRSDREIAEALFISPKTVGTHVLNLLGKLGVPSRAAAVAYAHRHGRA